MNPMNQNLISYVVSVTAFACFIVCPRMTAMTNLLTKYSFSSINLVVAGGTVVSLPLLIVTAWAIRHWGLFAGLALAIFTDIVAALVLKSVSAKAAIETLIIAAFVVVGFRGGTSASSGSRPL